MVYRALVTARREKRQYTGLTARSFKERIGEHYGDIRRKDTSKKKGTALSRYIRGLPPGCPYSIEWQILEHAPTFNGVWCPLCDLEKVYIAKPPDPGIIILNKKDELLRKCYHIRAKLC